MIKKILSDSFINILSSIIVTMILQLLVLPFISREYSGVSFGNILTILAIISSFSMLIGGSLNNIRLINNKTNFSSYMLILLISILCSYPFIYIFLINLSNETSIFFLLILYTLMTIKTYAMVYYRISLSYKSIFFQNLFLSIGYLIGFLIYKIFSNWIVIYLSGEIISILYILPTIFKFKREFLKDSNFLKIIKDYLIFSLSNIVNVLSMYMDRFILVMLINPKAVSIYFGSTLLGKTLSIMTVPISGVLLSYFSYYDIKNVKKIYNQMLLLVILVCTFIFIVIFATAPYVMEMLYPDLYIDIKPYLFIGNLSAILFLAGNFMNTFALKFINIKYQVYIQYVYLIFYMLSSIILIRFYKIDGFLYSTCISNLLRFILIHFYTKTNILNNKVSPILNKS